MSPARIRTIHDGVVDSGDPAAFLATLGAEETPHTGRTLMAHLRGTRDTLVRWGCPEYLCTAGLYHSIYGTELFGTATLGPADRDRLRAVVGARAERIAYLYGAMVRTSLYENLRRDGAYSVVARGSAERIALAGHDELADLFTLDLANRLEQLPRSSMSLHRMAADRRIYEQAAPLLPAAAVAALRHAFPRRSAAHIVADGIARGSRRVVRRFLARLAG